MLDKLNKKNLIIIRNRLFSPQEKTDNLRGNFEKNQENQINHVFKFNKDLWTKYSKVYDKEFRNKNVIVALRPAMNIMRNPSSRRIWENCGEDQYLSGNAGTFITNSIQSTGIIG